MPSTACWTTASASSRRWVGTATTTCSRSTPRRPASSTSSSAGVAFGSTTPPGPLPSTPRAASGATAASPSRPNSDRQREGLMSEITFESTSRLFTAGDIKLHANEVGEGPPLILLHGSGPGATSWSNFKQNLPALSQKFQVFAVDHPGYGLSDKPEFTREDSIFKVTSRALAAMLDDLGIDK